MYLHCNGSFSGILTDGCPTQRAVSTCKSLNTASAYSCRLVKSTETNTTCHCSAVDTNGVASSATVADIDVVSMLDYLQEDFVDTWKSAASLDEAGLKKSMNILLLLAGLVSWLLAGLVFLPLADQRSRRKVHSSGYPSGASGVKGRSAVTESRVDEAAGHREADEVSGSVKSVEAIEKLLHEAVPECFTSKYSLHRFLSALPQHHRWLSPLFHYSESVPRLHRMLSLWNQLITQLFFTVVFYNR